MCQTRRTLLLLVVTVSFGWASFAAANWYIGRGPRMVVAPSKIDFGEHEHGANLSVDIEVSNEGRQPLVLKNFAPSCGCLSILTRLPTGELEDVKEFVVAPGETRILVAGMVTSDFIGVRENVVAFESNDSNAPDGLLQMRADLYGRVFAHPKAINLGRIHGNAEPVRIRLRDTGRKQRFELDRIECVPEGIVSCKMNSVHETVETFPAGTDVLELFVHVNPSLPGPIRGKISIFGKDREEPVVVIPVDAEVVQICQIRPERILLPRHTSYGLSYQGTATISMVDGTPFTLSCTDPPEGLHVNQVESSASRDRHTLLLKADPQKLNDGVIEVHLDVTLENSQRTSLVLPVRLWRPQD